MSYETEELIGYNDDGLGNRPAHLPPDEKIIHPLPTPAQIKRAELYFSGSGYVIVPVDPELAEDILPLLGQWDLP